MVASIYGAADRAYALTPVAVQTSAYTAAANQLVPLDTSSGAVTVTLPTAPPDRTVIGIKLVNGSNAATIATGSGDVFNKAGGATSTTLTVLYQGVIAQYSASSAIWYIASDDLPLAQLDQRYAPLTAVAGVYNVKAAPYNAYGDGIHDDTAAIHAAQSDAHAAGGGFVYLPRGTYLVSALTWNNGSTGYRGVHLVGAGEGATILKKSAAGHLLVMSGPATDLSGATHCSYCSLRDMTVDGGGFTGMLVQSYYADNLTFERVHFQNNADTVQQTAEYWDCRYVNCVWDSCGSTVANTVAPNVWLCNTAAASGFGASTDVVNHVYFWGCRWESFRTGAVRIERGPGGGTGQPAVIFFTDCKMETVVLNGGNHLYVDPVCQFIDVEHLYCYSGGFSSGYSTAQDVISFSPQVGSLRDVRIFNASASATIANGVTVNSPLSTGLVTLDGVRGKYITAPTGAHLNFGGNNAGPYRIGGVSSDAGAQVGGTLPTLYAANQPLNLVAGSVGDGSFATTPLDGTGAIDTLHKRLYLRHSSGTWSRIPLNTIASSVTSGVTVANTTALSALSTASVPANEPQSGTVYTVHGSGQYSDIGTPTLTFSLYWGGTGGTLIVATPAITLPSGVTGAAFSFDVTLTFWSATTVQADLNVRLQTSTGTGAMSTYGAATASAVTVTTNATEVLAVCCQWGTASTSNTITLTNGLASKLN